MASIRTILASNLKAIRMARGLSQVDVSEMSLVSQQYLSGLESGKRNATVETLEKLAKVLKVSVSDLLRDGGGG